LPPRHAFPWANEALAEALKRDNRLGEAYASRGWIRFSYEWDFPAAEADFRRGLELSPNSAVPPSNYGNFLRCMKRYEESRAQMERALAIDPMDPVNLADASALCDLMRQPAKAEGLARRALEIDPAAPYGAWALARIYARTNRADQAIELLEKSLAVPRPDMLGLLLLGHLYVDAGKTAEARKVLKTMMRHPSAAQSMIAEVYAWLGEKDRAIEWLEKGFAEREPHMVWLNLSPDNHPLWGDPRFQDILRRMNFPR
jgi:Tfp pilus assembly protein PilF